MFNAIITGSVQGAIVGVACQTKVTEMALVGAGTAFIRCLLGSKAVNDAGIGFDSLNNSASEAEFMKLLRKVQLKVFTIHLIDTVIFVIAARRLGVFGPRGTSIYLGLKILFSLKQALFL